MSTSPDTHQNLPKLGSQYPVIVPPNHQWGESPPSNLASFLQQFQEYPLRQLESLGTVKKTSQAYKDYIAGGWESLLLIDMFLIKQRLIRKYQLICWNLVEKILH